MQLVEQDFVDAAAKLNCEVEAIKAVCQVEAPRGGFNPDNSPVTLFEGHVFSKYTKGKFDATHPTISYPKWTRQFYGKTWLEEKARLDLACSMDRTAGLMSASWGRFQIMGFNYTLVGFKSVQAFVNAMYKSEGAQLEAFCAYVVHECLDDELRELRWADFAKRYNGPEYWKNKYDEKLEKAYKKLKGLA